MNPEIENAIRVVAEFDGWIENSVFPIPDFIEPVYWTHHLKGEIYQLPEYDSRDAVVEAALKLPEPVRAVWAVKVMDRIESCFTHDAMTAPAEVLLIALAETIQEMKGEG